MSTEIDLNVFNNIEDQPSSKCEYFKSCIAFRRLIAALSYYQSLNVQLNEEHQNIYINFMNEIYQHSLVFQDLYHFMKVHGNKLHNIMEYTVNNNLIRKCAINSCESASRHYRVNDQNENFTTTDDAHLNVYIDTMDSFHYLLLHSYQTGMRYLHKPDEDGSTDNQQRHECYDAAFARISKIVMNTQKETRRFDRVSSSNKFKIAANDGSDGNKYKSEDHLGITYLDSVVQHFEDNKIKQRAIQKLINYLRDQHFDTDSMDIDVGDGSLQGNISIFMQRYQRCLQSLLSMLKQTKGILLSVTVIVLMYICRIINVIQRQMVHLVLDFPSDMTINIKMTHYT